MKRLQILLFLSLSLMTGNTIYAQPAEEVKTAYDVLGNAITAMGGKDYLLTIKTLYTDISTEMEGRQVHWITKEMIPNKGSFQIVYNNRIVFQNWFDGKKGYEIVNGEKRKADPKEFEAKKYKKNIFNELDYIDSTLWKPEMVGEEKVNEEVCFKIRVTSVNKEVRELYFSKNSFHLLREDKLSNADKGSFSSVYLSDFKKVGGLTFPATMKFGSNNIYQVGKIVELLINEKITDKDF